MVDRRQGRRRVETLETAAAEGRQARRNVWFSWLKDRNKDERNFRSYPTSMRVNTYTSSMLLLYFDDFIS